MSKKIISWSFTAQVAGGPSISASDKDLKVDFIDEGGGTIPKNSVETTVNVQPGSSGVKLLIITASSYEGLTYKVVDSTTEVKLDDALILVGEGAISLLDKYPTEFKFKNASTTDDVTVRILVGRDAVSPTPTPTPTP